MSPERTPHEPSPSAAGALIAGGRPGEALALARRAIEHDPQNPEWLHLLAVALHLKGASGEAAATLEKVLRLSPADAVPWNSYGAVQVERGELDSAEAALREALRLKGDYLEARFNLALLLRRKRDLAGALAELDRVLALRPDYLPGAIERATLQLEMGEAAAALRALEPLLERFPADPKLLASAAAASQRCGEEVRALDLCRRAAARPDIDPSGTAWVAQTLATLGHREEAARIAHRAAALAPDSPDVRERAGDALAAAGLHLEARAHYVFASRRARDRGVLEKLAAASLAAGDPATAAEALREHWRAVPGSRSTPQNLAIALDALGQADEAKAVVTQAIAAGHDDAELLSVLANFKMRSCDWDGLEELANRLRAKAAIPSQRPAHPPVAMYLAQVTAAEQRRWAENWARARLPAPASPRPGRRARGASRLRVGFLSGEFRAHATSELMVAMLEQHDRERYELIAYSYGKDDGSGIRRRVQGAFDRFVEVGALTARETAARIRADDIDILIDLSGFLDNSRLEVLALRPARTQGHFLGFPATTGAPFVDFFIADRITVAEGMEDTFTERVLRMPVCYQPNDPLRAASPTPKRAQCGLPEDAFVFCSLNQPMKIDAAVFERWCRLLHAVPKSCLWLLARYDAQRNLASRARALGIDAARLVFAPKVPEADHLARLRNADIALDTFPCTSHTTASDAIRAGVPLITTAGETFASRVAASVVRAAGCGNWAFDDPGKAFEATLALARDPRALREARAQAQQAIHSPLFDAAAFARGFEALLERAAAS